MTKLVLPDRPQLPDDVVRGTFERLVRADEHCVGELLLRDCKVRVLAVRGYFRRTMGDPTKNDVGIVDDAAFVITPKAIGRFNMNTDPSRLGINRENGKHMAVLAPGVWPYKRGTHRGEPGHIRQPHDEDAGWMALPTYFGDERALGEFTVLRDGVPDVGDFGINHHSASTRSTSSAGCQTWPPSQWTEYRDMVYRALDDAGQAWLPYVLTAETLA